jgi:FtsP/CotA-like multicopper oxidase with cupredoxin domain
MVRIGRMARLSPMVNRRTLLAGLGGLALNPAWPATGQIQGRAAVALRASVASLALRPDGPATQVWSLGETPLQLKRGQPADVEVRNDLSEGVYLNWRGIDAAPALEPLLPKDSLVASGRSAKFKLDARHAGTFACELISFGGAPTPPSRAMPVIIAEPEVVAIDADQVLLVEEWRLRADDSAIPPGMDSEKSVSIYTVNGKSSFGISANKNQRLRLRFINGSQRTVIAIKLDAVELRVMAIDGQPAEPFPARNGAVVLPPGGRLDAFVEATASSSILLHDGKEARAIGKLSLSAGPAARNEPLPPAPPLPSNGLPAQIDLKKALRFEIALAEADLLGFFTGKPPAFRAKLGRPVVLTLTNRASVIHVFHLHGHHFRLLDRLDDGWKPFWLDTLAIEPGQTQRIAFLAEHAGGFLIESVATDWAAPRLVRWYAVE